MQRGKRPPGDVDHQLLGDGVAAAGITPDLARAQRRRGTAALLAGFGAVEHLDESEAPAHRPHSRRSRWTVRPAVWLRSRRSVTFSVLVNSFSGTFQDVSSLVDIFVESQLPLLDQAQRRQRGDRLADGGGLEERMRRHRSRGSGLGHAVALGPFDGAVVDDGDADAGGLQIGDPLGERLRGQGPPGDDEGGQQPALDAGDPGLDGAVCSPRDGGTRERGWSGGQPQGGKAGMRYERRRMEAGVWSWYYFQRLWDGQQSDIIRIYRRKGRLV